MSDNNVQVAWQGQIPEDFDISKLVKEAHVHVDVDIPPQEGKVWVNMDIAHIEGDFVIGVNAGVNCVGYTGAYPWQQAGFAVMFGTVMARINVKTREIVVFIYEALSKNT